MKSNQILAKKYERAASKMEKHIKRNEDGTFALGVTDGKKIGIKDPIIFADLNRSMEETNRMITEGIIDPKVIEDILPAKRAKSKPQPSL